MFGIEASAGLLVALVVVVFIAANSIKILPEYERGVGLVKRCREVLQRAELRVEELSTLIAQAPTPHAEENPDDPDRR